MHNIIPLMVNFIFIGILAMIVLKIFNITYKFGFTTSGLGDGLKKFALPGVIAVLYYVGVGIVEEFYVRGLFLNVVETFACKNANKTEIAIIVSSVVFGLGHIPGMIGMGIGEKNCEN